MRAITRVLLSVSILSTAALLWAVESGAQVAPSTTPSPTVTHITGDVYEFEYLLTTGPGPYHQVRLHRVVRVENRKPIVSDNAIFLVHGDGVDFNSGFMGGTHSAYSLPVYLAQNGIDAWGIDLGWTLVPQHDDNDHAFFTFMKNWGLQRDIDDVEKALKFARDVRHRTGSDGGRFTLLGWSRGVEISYALLNQESQQSCAKRQVKAYIPMEGFFKLNDPTAKSVACSNEVIWKQTFASGIYNDNSGQFLLPIASLAETDPNGISAYLGAPITNLQAELIVDAQGYAFGVTYTLWDHFAAGILPGPSGPCPPALNCDPFAIPAGLAYQSISRDLDVATAVPPFESGLVEAEGEEIACGDVSLPFDKHLHDITVPVLYIGAHGAFGTLGLYTLSLLGSEDVTHHIVTLIPCSTGSPTDPNCAAAVFDYGHGDLFNANNAKDLVWSKILRWLRDHEGDENNNCPAQ